jgi:hypothetical protein
MWMIVILFKKWIFTQVIASIQTCGNNMNITNYYLLVLDGHNLDVTIDVPIRKWGDLQVTLQLRFFELQ